MFRSTSELYVEDLVGTIATTVFARSLSNFTCKLWMMRGGTLSNLGHGVKGQGQLCHSVYKTLWFIHAQQRWRGHAEEGKVNFGTLCIVDTIATTVFSQSLSNFTFSCG